MKRPQFIGLMLLAFLLSSTIGYSQCKIRGSAMLDYQSVIGAVISIKIIDKYAVTDVDRYLEIDNIPAGNYLLVAEYLGVQKFEFQIIVSKQMKPIDIRLVADSKILKGVEVTAV